MRKMMIICFQTSPHVPWSIGGWSSIINDWLVVWNMLYVSIYWECHHPNWRAYFSEGLVETTNQMRILYPHIWIPMIWDDQGPLELLLPAKIAEFGEIEGSQCMYVYVMWICLIYLYLYLIYLLKIRRCRESWSSASWFWNLVLIQYAGAVVVKGPVTFFEHKPSKRSSISFWKGCLEIPGVSAIWHSYGKSLCLIRKSSIFPRDYVS